MSTNATTRQESSGTDVEPRTERALTEYMSVLPEGGEMFTVVGENHPDRDQSTYTVDLRRGRCSCGDATYRNIECKHQIRAKLATGRAAVPAGFTPDDVAGELGGEHLDGEPRFLATDGGVVDAVDDAEILDDSPAWGGPFTEYDKHGRPTGHAYVRCPDCGVEVLTGDKDRASHRPACRHVDE